MRRIAVVGAQARERRPNAPQNLDAAEVAEFERELGAVFRSLKSECLSRIIFFGEQSLRNATTQFVEHYHAERNHQGLENKLIEPGAEVGLATGEVECRERLGGLLNYYHRCAA